MKTNRKLLALFLLSATASVAQTPPDPATTAGTPASPKVRIPNVLKKPVVQPQAQPEEGSKVTKDGKQLSDTDKLPQFEQSIEFEPRSPNYKVSFSLEDADLAELVKVISQLTGKRFIFGNKVKSNLKASVYSPQKVTVAEAYQAFLSILETNGLTVIPQGRFLKIVDTQGVAQQGTPIHKGPTTGEDRYVTRMHRLKSIPADEVSKLLEKFKSKDAEVLVYGPGNMLIITDTGSNIRRMMQIVEEIDVGGAGDQIWIEPVHYASATELAKRIEELFDVKAAASGKGAPGTASPGVSGVAELHIAKILPDDRTNSLIIVATEKAYLRTLELLKKIDVPQSSEGEIHVLPLQHADAVELAKTLTEIVAGANQAQPGGAGKPGSAPPVSGIFEGGVKISADKSTNSLVVTSSMRDYAALHGVVDKLDHSRKQVFIEAVIMDLTVERQRNLGISWHGGVPEQLLGGSGESLILGGLDASKSALFPRDPSVLNGLALGVRGPGIPGTESLFGGSGAAGQAVGLSIPAFGVVLNAIANSGDSDVLSTPHIIATDNVDAEINIGENVPRQTNSNLGNLAGLAGAAGGAGAAAALPLLSGGLNANPGFQDVGTKIKFTPHMNESNEVRLELKEFTISEAKAAVGTLGVVPLTKRSTTTQLIVQDQQTVVIGGFMRNRIATSEKKIPLLGDLPLLGALFRQRESQVQKSNLVLILTPHIIREPSDMRKIFERKMQERQEFLDRYFVFNEDHEYRPPKDYSRTNGLVEEVRQAYRRADEKLALDELTKPRKLKIHAPTLPIEMPAAVRSGGATTTTAPAAEAPVPSRVNVPGVVRNLRNPAVPRAEQPTSQE